MRGENLRLYEAEQRLNTVANTYQRFDAEIYNDDITWMLRKGDIYGYAVNSSECLVHYNPDEHTITLRATSHDERSTLNRALPDGVRIKSVKRDRWVVAGLNNARQVPFHNGIALHDLAHRVSPAPECGWAVRQPLPYPNKQHIPKTIQRLVKKWAGNYRYQNNVGACGMCIAHNENLMGLDVAEVKHLMEHILSGALPYVMMDTIVRDSSCAWYVLPFRQACYQIAVAYAYKTLRSTYA